MPPHHAARYPPAFNPSDLDGSFDGVAGLFEQFNNAVLYRGIVMPGRHDGPAWVSWNWARYWRKCFEEAMRRLREQESSRATNTAPVSSIPDSSGNSDSLEKRVKDLEEMVSKLAASVTVSFTVPTTTTASLPITTTSVPITSRASVSNTTTISTPILTPNTTPGPSTRTESPSTTSTLTTIEKKPTVHAVSTSTKLPPALPHQIYYKSHNYYFCYGCRALFLSKKEIDMHSESIRCGRGDYSSSKDEFEEN